MSGAENDQGRLARIVGSVVVGLVLAGIGLWFVQPDSPPTFGAIECDGTVMEPGDKCIVVRGGGKDFTYESEQASRQSELATWRDDPGDEIIGWGLIGLGVLVAVGGSVVAARPKRGLRAELASVPAVSPEVWAVVAQHGLGGGSLTHRSKDGEVRTGVGCTVLFAVLAFALFVGPAAHGGWTAFLAVFAAIGAIFCLTATLKQMFVAGTVLHLFDHGLVYAQGGAMTVFPWRDTEIRRSVVQQQNASKPDYRYWLQRPGAQTVQFRPSLGLDEFGPEMERRLTADRAPADLEAVAAGQRVQYGPFAVDHAGLTTPKGTIAWPRVRAVELKKGAVEVWEVDARRSQSVDAAQVPNVFVFLALAETLRRA